LSCLVPRSASGEELGSAPPFEQFDCSTPGALAPVRVVLSRPIITYPAPSAPLTGMPRLRRATAYTRHPRCALRPRRPVSGSGLSLPVPSRHVVLSDPGESTHASAPSTSTGDSGLRPPEKGSALPTSPQAVSRGAQLSGLPGSLPLQPAELLASLTARPGLPPASETFTSGLPTGRSLFPPPDMTTVVAGRLHRRDFHPLEQQLASLHP
jgi:hypothetical protein